MKITLFDIRLRIFQSAMVLLLTSAVTQHGLAAAHYQIVKSDLGSSSSDPILQGSDGRLYGGDAQGGLFKINKDGSGYRFLATGDNSSPRDLVQGTDGALYGTDGGVVFKLHTDGTGYKILHTFGRSPSDGMDPNGLIEGKEGVLYGTTDYGGANTNQNLPWGLGTVFRLNKDGTGYSIIHHFGSAEADGLAPWGKLLQGSDGALYGTTWEGGSNGVGTVFKLTTYGGSYSILKHLDFGCAGGYPREGVIEGSDGVLYGTTGDWYCGVGTVFRINKDGTDYRVLLNTERLPGAIIEGRDGTLYGTTGYGGAFTNEFGGLGTLFGLNKDGTGYTSLHDFGGGVDGYYPGNLILGNDSAFYGVAGGHLFRLWPPATPDTVAVRNTQGVAQFTIVGIAGFQYQVLRSPNLQNWSVVTNLIMPPPGLYIHTDNTPPAPAAFYRAAWIP